MRSCIEFSRVDVSDANVVNRPLRPPVRRLPPAAFSRYRRFQREKSPRRLWSGRIGCTAGVRVDLPTSTRPSSLPRSPRVPPLTLFGHLRAWKLSNDSIRTMSEMARPPIAPSTSGWVGSFFFDPTAVGSKKKEPTHPEVEGAMGGRAISDIVRIESLESFHARRWPNNVRGGTLGERGREEGRVEVGRSTRTPAVQPIRPLHNRRGDFSR